MDCIDWISIRYCFWIVQSHCSPGSTQENQSGSLPQLERIQVTKSRFRTNQRAMVRIPTSISNSWSMFVSGNPLQYCCTSSSNRCCNDFIPPWIGDECHSDSSIAGTLWNVYSSLYSSVHHRCDSHENTEVILDHWRWIWNQTSSLVQFLHGDPIHGMIRLLDLD